MKPETYTEYRIVKGRKIGIEYACRGGRKLRVWAVTDKKKGEKSC